MKLEDETAIDMKETETAEDVSQNISDENITKIFKKLMTIKRVPRH